jgi:hypothetical protein
MGAFEHVIVLLSFVYALAIAHLLMTTARIIGAWERVRFSWFHAYWMFNALIILVIDWVSYWDMRDLPNWSMVSIAVVMMQSFTDYMQAALVCPEIPAEGKIDLIAFHATRSRRYIGAFAITTVMALITNTYFGGTYRIGDLIAQNAAVLPLIAVSVTATIVRKRWVDIAAPILLLAIWTYYLVDLQAALK